MMERCRPTTLAGQGGQRQLRDVFTSPDGLLSTSTVITPLDPLDRQCGESDRQPFLVFRNTECQVNHNDSCHSLDTHPIPGTVLFTQGALISSWNQYFRAREYTDSVSLNSDFAQEKVSGRNGITVRFFSLLCTPTIHWNHQKGRKILLMYPLPIPAQQPCHPTPSLFPLPFIHRHAHTFTHKRSLGFKDGDEVGRRLWFPQLCPQLVSQLSVFGNQKSTFLSSLKKETEIKERQQKQSSQGKTALAKVSGFLQKQCSVVGSQEPRQTWVPC